MDNGNTECGNQADQKCTNHTAHGNTNRTVDSGKHLASDDASNSSPADLHDDVKDTGDLSRPVAHEISTEDLFTKPKALADSN